MMDRCSKCHQRHDGPCPSVKRIEAALALAEAVDAAAVACDAPEGTPPEVFTRTWFARCEALAAYRATAPKPPRTRAEVDAEKGRYLVAALAALNRGDIPWCRQMLQDARALCAEPTTPTDSGPSSEPDRPPPVAAAGAAYSHRADIAFRFLTLVGCSAYGKGELLHINVPPSPGDALIKQALDLMVEFSKSSGPRPTPATKESSDTAGVEAGAANRITDHDADQREVEACSCEESEALKAEIAVLRAKISDCANHAQSGIGKDKYPASMAETACRWIYQRLTNP